MSKKGILRYRDLNHIENLERHILHHGVEMAEQRQRAYFYCVGCIFIGFLAGWWLT